MKIYVLGIDHEIQTFDGRRTQEEKANFEGLVRALVAEHRIEFIGDETYAEKDAIAKSVANSLGIHWEPIEMTKEVRRELGIEHEQANRPLEMIPTIEGVQLGKEKRVASGIIREAYMVGRTLTSAAEFGNILILCGFIHADELRKRFEIEATKSRWTACAIVLGIRIVNVHEQGTSGLPIRFRSSGPGPACYHRPASGVARRNPGPATGRESATVPERVHRSMCGRRSENNLSKSIAA
jgi:hypothetical protein